jgi:beta-glucanase (GH16 family)
VINVRQARIGISLRTITAGPPRTGITPLKAAAILAVFATCMCVSSVRPVEATPPSGYTMTWHDEFNGAVGSAPNSANWSYNTGAGGWGNAELETYTTNLSNAEIVSDSAAPNGTALAVTATESGGDYYSARILTMGKEAPTYGYFEASINHPSGSGLWPAWWMLGAINNGWPMEGEIDIFEQFEANPTNEFSSFWYGASSSAEQGWSNDTTVSASGYQTYGILWTSTTTEEYYNGAGYGSHSNPGSPFNAAFYFLINLAVGGNPGAVGSGTVFPSSLKMGYLRVYEPTSSTSSTTSTTSSSTSGGGPANGSYQLYPECATGSRLDDAGALTTNGNKINIYASNGTGAQSWALSTTGVVPSGDYNLGVEGPYCLQESGTGNGAATELWACNGANAQSWSINAVSGWYQIHPASNGGECLDVAGAGTANGTVVDTYTCNSTNAQQWGGL